jgi:hypothetical protein
MAHDVFISYSSKDKDAGIAVCEGLERHGVRCWMAPRDIVPGQGWAKSILGAISNARVMVLLLTAEANVSPQIEREVERAVHRRVPIVPVRIEDVLPGEALEYFLSAPHWLDAFTPPLDQHLDRLAAAVRTALESRPAMKEPAADEAPDAELEAEPEAVAVEVEDEPILGVSETEDAPEIEEEMPPPAATPYVEEEQVEPEPEPSAETSEPVPGAITAGAADRKRKLVLIAALTSVAAVVIVVAAAASIGYAVLPTPPVAVAPDKPPTF